MAVLEVTLGDGQVQEWDLSPGSVLTVENLRPVEPGTRPVTVRKSATHVVGLRLVSPTGEAKAEPAKKRSGAKASKPAAADETTDATAAAEEA